MKVTCIEPGCTRHVWFTVEQLCRPHGLAGGVHLDPIDVREDAIFAETTNPTERQGDVIPPESLTDPITNTPTLSEGENDG